MNATQNNAPSWKWMLSLGIGVLMAAFPLIAERIVPYQPAVYTVVDGVWLPGSLLARIFYPAGIHTGRGSDVYVPLAFIFNLVIYWAIAFGVLAIAQHRRIVKRSLKDEEN